MAEILVRAMPHYMDALSKKEVDNMDDATRLSYEARTQVGDIIVVRPDGWPWGDGECLPTFLVVKIPSVSMEDVKHYELPLMNPEGTIMLKFRKHCISANEVAKASIEAAKSEKIVPVELSVGESVTEKTK